MFMALGSIDWRILRLSRVIWLAEVTRDFRGDGLEGPDGAQSDSSLIGGELGGTLTINGSTLILVGFTNHLIDFCIG